MLRLLTRSGTNGTGKLLITAVPEAHMATVTCASRQVPGEPSGEPWSDHMRQHEA
jgi:hypothetical protein